MGNIVLIVWYSNLYRIVYVVVYKLYKVFFVIFNVIVCSSGFFNYIFFIMDMCLFDEIYMFFCDVL